MAKQSPSSEQSQDVAAPQLAPQMSRETDHTGGLTGRRVGDYQLVELLGAGGMADVYRAYDRVLMRDVAVKVLRGPLSEDGDYVDRFRAEARRVAALRHPHLVPVYHAGEAAVDGQHLLYLVMPLLHESLDGVLEREGKLPPAEAARLVLQVADGLEAAHRHGLVHRDVKPGNILLDAQGQALLTDFGLASEVRRTSRQVTRQPWGTPEYMAPEQLHNTAVDQRADLYAVGVVLYELLTGKRPFEGGSAYHVAALALQGPLKPPSTYDSGILPELERVVLTALAREPGDRYPNMAEFALALRQAVGQQSGADVAFTSAVTVPLPERFWSSQRSMVHANWWRSRRWVLALAATAAILVAGLGGVLVELQHRDQPPHDIKGPIGQTSPTSTGSPLPVQSPLLTPLPTARATNTPHARPTPAATATAKPAPPLTIAPTPLVLSPSSTNPKTCMATQAIQNTTNSSVGWAWQKPTVAGFHFQIDGGPSVGWPTATTNTPAGATSTLVVTSDCKPQAISYAILVNDSFGGQYTFIMTLE